MRINIRNYILFYILCFALNVNGQILDTIREYHSNGQKRCEMPTLNGKYQGLVKAWYEDGQLSLLGNYDQGKPIDKNIQWYPNKQIKCIIIYSKGSIIKQEMWYIPGKKMSQYNMTKRKSKTVYWFDDGKKSFESLYKNGLPAECSEIRSLSDTNLKSVINCFIGNQEVFIRNGIIYDSLNNVIANKFKGKNMLWYKNGQLQSRINYKNGQIDGILCEWSEAGKVTRKEIYKNGKLVSKEI